MSKKLPRNIELSRANVEFLVVGGRRQRSGGAQKAEWIIGIKLQSFSDRIAGYHPAVFLKLCNCSFSFARGRKSFKILQLLKMQF